MPTKPGAPKPTWVVQQLIDSLTSDRKPRPVVTPSGHRARGHFPSIKSRETRYESLVEEDALRILEIAPSVLTVRTHPFVLRLRDPRPERTSSFLHYTPDALVVLEDTSLVVEVKGDWLLKLPAPRDRLRLTLRALRMHEVPIALLTETDVRPAGLQVELKELLRDRPVGSRIRSNVDVTAWDPTGAVQPSGETLRRWREAQKACDQLLDRVMRRDPDELIASLEA